MPAPIQTRLAHASRSRKPEFAFPQLMTASPIVFTRRHEEYSADRKTR